MRTLLQDLRYGFRRLRQSPGFTIVCVITLALGIGANTAIFTLVDAVMLKSLPVANPNELHRLGDNENCCVNGGYQDDWAIYSYAQYQQFRDHTPEFSQMAAFQAGLMDLSARRSGAAGPAEPFVGEFVSGNYFSTFGLSAFAGRLIMPSDDKPGAAPVAVISYRTWQQHFGLDPSVVGAAFTINAKPYNVAGVAPPGFFGDQLRPDPPDFWIPLSTEPALNGQGSILNHPDTDWLYIVGRLKPGARPAAVQSKVTVQLQHWLSVQPDLTARDRAELSKQHIVVVSAGGGVANMEQETAAGLRLLMTISGLVLLIACANIANLLLARGAATRSETAIRVALGAPRARLIRQIVTESVLLAVVGGLAGLGVAFIGTRTILLLAFRGSHYVPISPTPSLAVLGFAFVLSLVTGVVFGAAPAWITSHSDPAEALRGAGRSTRDRASLARRSLVILQVALSAVLLIGAGLLTESLRNLENQRFGFETEGRLVAQVDPSLAGYTPDKLYGLYQQLEQRLPQMPGVVSASYSLYSPMRGDNWSSSIHLEGRAEEERGQSPSWDRVGPRYFETIGTRLLRGRVIGDQDTPTSRRVAVVNQTFARKFFPKEDPMGKHFGIGDATHAGDFEIVGVVEDAKYQSARDPAYATFFLPFLQPVKDKDPSYITGMLRSNYMGDIELHVAGKPEDLEATLRRTLAGIDPNLTVLRLMRMTEQLAGNFNQDRLIARLTELFGGLALILACVGLYGVTAYSVARRTGEIGIGMALGANRGNVLALVLRGALLQLGVGLAVGIPVALAGGRLLASQLYGVKSHDPLILGLAAAVLAACALVAGFVPARRAASIDPMRALRTE
ncbi:MAG TPA: ABC transporter permease [Terriglobia bacterium]|nr:ABC transporter permease [Terriglobia bacterium]